MYSVNRKGNDSVREVPYIFVRVGAILERRITGYT
jgi:hypothetical protein